MKLSHQMLLGGAVTMVAVLGGCMADESAPTRPRTENTLGPSEKAKDNAFNRETEAPKRDLPTSGSEFPGQSKANVKEAPGEKPVVTADAGVYQYSPYGSFQTPTTDYKKDYSGNGPLPHLQPNPGSVPAVGSTPVPNIPWAIDHSWGEVLTLENAAHRAWPDMQTQYRAADVKHNPVYYFNLQDHSPWMWQNDGSYHTDWVTEAIEFPWFYGNTAILPVLMILEPPLAQRTTQRIGPDANYLGHLPAGGEIVPSPTPGEINWVYPFLRADYDQNPTTEATTEATTQPSETAPAK